MACCTPENSDFFDGTVKVADCCRLRFCNADNRPLYEFNLANTNFFLGSSGGLGLNDGVTKKTLTESDAIALGFPDMETLQAFIETERAKCCDDSATEPPTDPIKLFVQEVTVTDPDNPKKNILFWMWQNTETGEICYTAVGDDPNAGGAVIPNFTNLYQMNLVGLPQFLPIQEVVEKTFEWCPAGGSYTYADIVAEAVAQGAVLTNGTAPDGIIKLEVIQEYKGQQCAGKTTTGTGTTINGNVTLDGGQKFCEAIKYIDADCDGKADACYDLTTTVEVPQGAGHVISGQFVVCDTDPNDPNV